MSTPRQSISLLRRRAIVIALMAGVSILPPGAVAQDALQPGAPTAPAGGWSTGAAPDATPGPPADLPPQNVTVVPRAPGDNSSNAASEGRAAIQLVALLTTDGQHIDQGLIWRIYRDQQGRPADLAPLSTLREASPIVELAPGNYIVNAAFGRAHLTRRITVAQASSVTATEQFVLNAGGLRLAALIGGKAAPPNAVTYDIFTDRDQTDSRRQVMTGAKPGLIIRLNAGIYHVVSTYGDGNATVRSDVTVEAGKLTEATITHSFAKVTFRLVARPGGEALPGTEWSVQTDDGHVVKESVGALPTHTLAPGDYVVIAKSFGQTYTRRFKLVDGQIAQIEVTTELR
ncbi:MAG: hypothetical protein NW216_09695 [Hyphomicrobium sp.]|nr:hypothetical protein [Hyphomicrobium sp.]